MRKDAPLSEERSVDLVLRANTHHLLEHGPLANRFWEIGRAFEAQVRGDRLINELVKRVASNHLHHVLRFVGGHADVAPDQLVLGCVPARDAKQVGIDSQDSRHETSWRVLLCPKPWSFTSRGSWARKNAHHGRVPNVEAVYSGGSCTAAIACDLPDEEDVTCAAHK